MLKSFLTGFAICAASVTSAHAVTVTQSASYIGDVCDDFDGDGGISGTDFNDCNQVVQNGGPVGLFSLQLLGLNPQPLGDATFTVSSTNADLFAVGGGNNPMENFGFSLDGFSLGTLFDGSTADEAAINPGLAAAVQSNIDAATDSDGPISLTFSLALADFAPLVSDGSITALFDFRSDFNVNSFRNVVVNVNYAAVPLPAGIALLMTGLFGLGIVGRRRS